MPAFVVLIIVLAGALALGFMALCVAELFRRLRVRALRRHAQRAGLEFRAELAKLPDGPMRCLPLFRRAGEREIRNLLIADMRRMEVSVFRYSYPLRIREERASRFAGQALDVYTQTVVLARVSDADFPTFELREADNLHDKAVKWSGHGDLPLPNGVSVPPQYFYRGEDAQRVTKVVTARLVEHLVQRDRLCVDASGEWVAVYRMNIVVDADELDILVSDAIEVVSMLRGR
jgi:hypothetical protein